MFSSRMAKFSIGLFLLFLLSSCADKTVRPKHLRVVCLGDSITYGYKLANPASQSYPAQLGRLSRGQWNVLNSGVNGATLLNKGDIPIIEQPAYKRAMQFRPDIVVVMLGTNDMKKINWKYLENFEADYSKLIKKIRTLPTRPHVIVCTIPPVFAPHISGINEKKVKIINEKVKEVITNDKIDLLDIYDSLLMKKAVFSDGIHPNARGAKEIASLVYHKISSL